ILVMRYPPIARVKDDPCAASQFVRQRQADKPRGECNRGRITLELNTRLSNPTLCESPGLIESENFEGIHTPSPKPGETEQQTQYNPTAAALGNKTFRMEIGDAIDEFLSEQEIEWHDEVRH